MLSLRHLDNSGRENLIWDPWALLGRQRALAGREVAVRRPPTIFTLPDTQKRNLTHFSPDFLSFRPVIVSPYFSHGGRKTAAQPAARPAVNNASAVTGRRTGRG